MDINNEFRSSVAITIQSDSHHDGQQEQSTVEVRGDWVRKGDTFYLRYREVETATSSLIKWTEEAKEVWVIRQGDVSVRQHFIPKVELYTVYTTPYAQFALRTLTDKLEIEVDKEGGGGMLQLKFVTQLEDSDPTEHRMTIRFTVLS